MKTDAGVVFLVKAAAAEQLLQPMSEQGVLLVCKPFSNTLFLQAIHMAAASNHRLQVLRQENARLRRETEERRQAQAGALLRLQAEEERIRQVYPDFDWKRELASPRFGRLVTAGVDGQTAYEIVHRQELLQAAMAYAAAQARSQTARAIASGGGRVAENRGGSRTVTRSDPKSLSSRELADIRRRVQDGEKIRF